MLPPLIEKGHDDIDSGSLAVAGRDDALQVLKMVVWRHMVDEAVHVVGDAMVADIHHQKQILPSDGFSENCLPFAAAESGRLQVHQIVVLAVAVKGRVVFYDVVMNGLSEFN